MKILDGACSYTVLKQLGGSGLVGQEGCSCPLYETTVTDCTVLEYGFSAILVYLHRCRT